jgi:hypothetical protein
VKSISPYLTSSQKWINVAVLILAMLVSGCVSHPSSSTVQPWPDPPAAGYSMLMIYWPQTHWDQGGGGPWFNIDDVKTFKLHVNHYSWIYVRSGQHALSTVWGFKIFGWNPINGLNMNKDITFEDGKSYYLRMSSWAKGAYVIEIHVALHQVTEEVAKKEAGTCWFIKPLVSKIDGKPEQSVSVGK